MPEYMVGAIIALVAALFGALVSGGFSIRFPKLNKTGKEKSYYYEPVAAPPGNPPPAELRAKQSRIGRDEDPVQMDIEAADAYEEYLEKLESGRIWEDKEKWLLQ